MPWRDRALLRTSSVLGSRMTKGTMVLSILTRPTGVCCSTLCEIRTVIISAEFAEKIVSPRSLAYDRKGKTRGYTGVAQSFAKQEQELAGGLLIDAVTTKLLFHSLLRSRSAENTQSRGFGACPAIHSLAGSCR